MHFLVIFVALHSVCRSEQWGTYSGYICIAIVLYSLFHCIAREELIKLQRDYRKSEGLRKSITEASQNDIRKQKYSSTSMCVFVYTCCDKFYRAMIVMLESENEELRKNLGLASSRQNERRDQMVTKKFEELLTTQGMLTIHLLILQGFLFV